MSKYNIKIIWEREDDGNTLESFIDHTNLSPVASKADIIKLCNEAKEYNFKAVCVNPSFVSLCKEQLAGTDILICTVVGFPLGQNTASSKVFETIGAVNDGADEIDMVVNISDLKARKTNKILREIKDVVKASGYRTVKVIVETCLLTEEDKEYAIKLVSLSGAEYIKTSTGFSTAGAELEDIKKWDKWRSSNFSKIQIKAAGGIKSHLDAIEFIKAGANRLGTSRGVELVLNTRDDPNFFDSNKQVMLTDMFKNNKKIISQLSLREDESKKDSQNSKQQKVNSETIIETKEIEIKKDKKKDKGISFNQINGNVE